MKRIFVGALVAFLVLGTAKAKADFMIDLNPGGDKFFNGKANNDVSSFVGTVGWQNSGPLVTVGTAGNVDTGAGFSNIKPVKDGSLTSLTFTSSDGNLFGEFSFRGQLLDVASGTVNVTVQDNQGHPAQTFTFTGLGANADFARLGIVAVPGSGETIQSVTLTSLGFKEEKQNEFSLTGNGSGIGNIAAVPEPSALTLVGISIVCLAGFAWRRQKNGHAAA
jgi:PEP-CTERM motif